MADGIRKVVARDGQGQISVIEEPMPEPEPGRVLIEVKASMISPGTELGGVKRRRENPVDAPPAPFGYSSAGVVIGQGEGCEDIPLGTRLACMGGAGRSAGEDPTAAGRRKPVGSQRRLARISQRFAKRARAIKLAQP